MSERAHHVPGARAQGNAGPSPSQNNHGACIYAKLCSSAHENFAHGLMPVHAHPQRGGGRRRPESNGCGDDRG
eukprot:5472630-Alexandrium_andersonii.AAC.1